MADDQPNTTTILLGIALAGSGIGGAVGGNIGSGDVEGKIERLAADSRRHAAMDSERHDDINRQLKSIRDEMESRTSKRYTSDDAARDRKIILERVEQIEAEVRRFWRARK